MILYKFEYEELWENIYILIRGSKRAVLGKWGSFLQIFTTEN